MTNFNPRIGFLTKAFTEDIQGMNKNILSPESVGDTNFGTVLEGMVQQLNETANAPDTLMKDAVLGKADVHDVMAAISKSEIQINLASSITKKVLQTYEKVMNIQI